MAKTNTKTEKAPKPLTHEGAVAVRITPEQQLERSVMACLLWEDTFYEDGESIAERVRNLCGQVSAQFIADLAKRARHDMKLRHMPLFLLVQLLKKPKERHVVPGVGGSDGPVVRDVITNVISRADEMAELLALYAKENGLTGKTLKKIDNQLKRGLQQVFESGKFDAYQFGKYKSTGDEIALRDVIRLVHPKAKDEAQSLLFKQIANQTLPAPDTWEVALSGGADKKETFTRLLTENKLGGLALLRNLRNMEEAGVERKLILAALARDELFSRVLPFRFLSATKAAPGFDQAIDKAMVNRIADMPEFTGTTAVVIDVSGSMSVPVSKKSQLRCVEAGAALGALVNGDVRMYVFGHSAKEVPARKGLAGIVAVTSVDVGHSTNIPAGINLANKNGYDRIIVITDEQMQRHYDALPKPLTDKAYFINVGSYQNGVGYGEWTNITGFSENTLRYIQAMETGEIETDAVEG